MFCPLHQVFLTTICGVSMCGVHVFIYHINSFGMGITLLCASILSHFAINISMGSMFLFIILMLLEWLYHGNAFSHDFKL